MQTATAAAQGRWVPTVCNMCSAGCGVRVLVDNGVVLAVQGDADSPANKGAMCAKGKAAIMNLYNPSRLRAPLKRTNPQKGMDVDPQWEEISWDEALATMTEKLRQIKDDPKQLYMITWTGAGQHWGRWLRAFGTAFGSPHVQEATAPSCGKVVHPVEFFSGGGFHQQPDLHLCNYCILVGTQTGIGARHSFTHLARDMAEARARGMKLVVVDPIGVWAGSKADEWLPVRPGTDAALALGMLHVLLNELGIYDAVFLKKKSNAPYLVGPEGRYVRDPASKKPLIFDSVAGAAKTHDDPSIGDYALEGSYQVRGVRARPTFQVLKEHVANYPPEKVEAITTVPAETIRRVAREFGEAAQVGSTITIQGAELPYRPACVDWARGPQGHKHAFGHGWTLKLLNIVLGAVNVPGGILSTGAAGKFPWSWGPEGGTDGLLEHGGALFETVHTTGFPGRLVTPPRRYDLMELFPVAGHATTLTPMAIMQPEKYGLNYGIKVLIHTATNAMLGHYGDLKVAERFYQSIPFIVGFADEINETVLFDDIVLPQPAFLERYDFPCGYTVNAPVGTDDYGFRLRQPVVPPPPGVREPVEVFIELADRLGMLADLYRLVSHVFRLKGDYALKTGKKYSAPEAIDRIAKGWFGEDHGLEWFREHGTLRFARDVDVAYVGPFLKARLPIYLEHYLDRGEELRAVTNELGLDWDTSDYTPIPEWKACPSYGAHQKGEYDLVAVHYKLPYIAGAFSNENAWVNELCEKVPLSYAVLINEATAKKKGIREGDLVWVESPVHKARAKAKLSRCVHPEVVGIAGFFGHWSPGMPVAQGKGIAFNRLLPHDMDHIDMISTALDHCVEVKVYK